MPSRSSPFCANFSLYFFESKYVKNLIFPGSTKAYKYHGTVRFMDNLCVVNDGNDFFKSFKNIYHKRLELNLEYQELIPLYLALTSLSKIIFLYIRYFTKK